MSGALHTPLCDLLGCRYPIVQTAMGWVAGSSLVAATTNAGGFGFLAGATIPADRIEAEILPAARENLDLALRGGGADDESAIAIIEAQRAYGDISRKYLEALVRHRRSMFRINTAVGQRVLP